MSGVCFFLIFKVIFLLSPFEKLHLSLFYLPILFLTLGICNIYFFSTAKIVTLTPLNIIPTQLVYHLSLSFLCLHSLSVVNSFNLHFYNFLIWLLFTVYNVLHIYIKSWWVINLSKPSGFFTYHQV